VGLSVDSQINVCFTLQGQNLRTVEMNRSSDGAAVRQIPRSRNHHKHRSLFRLNLIFPVADLRQTDSRKTGQMCPEEWSLKYIYLKRKTVKENQGGNSNKNIQSSLKCIRFIHCSSVNVHLIEKCIKLITVLQWLITSGGQSTQIKYLSKSTDTYNKILLQ